MAKVSVIIPVYNKGKYLNRSIKSVLNQSYKDFNLILINDGSSDDSRQIIEEYKNKDSRIIYIEQENRGVSYSRNLGIEVSKSEYISFLDADDEIDSSFLEKMISRIGISNICCCGHYDIIDGLKIKPKLKFFQGDIIVKYIYNKCTPNTNSWLIKKDYLNKYNIRFSEDINYGEDMEFFAKVLLHDKNINMVEEPLTYYHRNKTNCLTERDINKIYKDLHWMGMLKDYVSRSEIDFKRQKKIIRAIDSYRIPAAIVYKMKLNYANEEKEKLNVMMNNLTRYLKEIRFSNGLRSIKLLYELFAIKLKFKL